MGNDRLHRSAGCGRRCVRGHLPAEHRADRGAEGGGRIVDHLHAPPRDVMVGADEKRAVVADLPLVRPLTEDIVVFTADADSSDVELDSELVCNLCCRGTPAFAVLADDQCERSVARDVDGRDAASTLFHPRVGKARSRMRRRLVVELVIADALGVVGAVVDDACRRIALSQFDSVRVELIVLKRDGTVEFAASGGAANSTCLLYTSPSPRD